MINMPYALMANILQAEQSMAFLHSYPWLKFNPANLKAPLTILHITK